MPFRHRAVRRVARAARHIGRAALRVGHRVASGGAAYLGTKAVSRAGRAASKYISRPPASRAPRVAHAKQGFRKFVAGVLHADPGTGADLTVQRVNVNLGTKKGLNNKLITASRNDTYYRFQNMSPFMNTTGASVYGGIVGGGAMALLNAISTRTPTAAYFKYTPLHVYDITTINNSINGSVVPSTPAYALRFTGTVGAGPIFPPSAVAFDNLSCYNLAGTSISTSLQLLKSKLPTVQAIEECLQEYVSVNLLVYGATNMATEWSIKVFQLRDDIFHPYEIQQLSGAIATPYLSDASSITFWESFASKSMKHPLAKESCDWKKHVKILKEMTFIQQPRLTNESDAVLGHSKQIKMFIPMYRKANYKWLDPALDTDVDNINSTPNQNGQLSCYLKPKARIYLSIQATNVTETLVVGAGAYGTTAYTPS